jgi:hypothetical protein
MQAANAAEPIGRRLGDVGQVVLDHARDMSLHERTYVLQSSTAALRLPSHLDYSLIAPVASAASVMITVITNAYGIVFRW